MLIQFFMTGQETSYGGQPIFGVSENYRQQSLDVNVSVRNIEDKSVLDEAAIDSQFHLS